MTELASEPATPASWLDATRFLGLDSGDFDVLRACLPALEAATGSLAQRFYAFMLSHQEMAGAFGDLSPERLASLSRQQAEHAGGLLRARLDAAWEERSRHLGRTHQHRGISPAWLAGAYVLYWQHWQPLVTAALPEGRRRPAREALFKLIIGDLMAQLGGYAEAARETDRRRLAIFDRFVGMVEGLAFQSDIGRRDFLHRICDGLVAADASVGFAGFLLALGDRTALAPEYIAGSVVPCARAIRRDDSGPFWAAFAARRPFVRAADAPDLPAWIRSMAGDVAEIAAVPIGDGHGFHGVGLLGVRRRGYLHRVGAPYFKAFAQLAELGLRLYAQNLRDPLTGLPNRVLFIEGLDIVRARAARHGRRFGVAMLDLDGFKRINDRFGHLAGDHLLRQVARRLRGELRAEDMLARLGGDEFGLLIAEAERDEDMIALCERLLAVLRRPFLIGHDQVEISGSLGLALFPRDPGDAQVLVRHADLAAYAAKTAGKDQVFLHTVALTAVARRADDAREVLVAALKHDRLRLHYQPIVAPDGGLLAVEALLRLAGPDGGLTGPGGVASALDHGRIARPLGRRVLALAGAQGAAWHRAGLTLRITVNISPSHLLAPRFLDDLREALQAEPDLPPGALILELTESAPLPDLAQAEGVFRGCAGLGVGIAIDDFGTGHTSLAWLRSLSPRMIKVDRSFVAGIGSADSREAVIISGLVAMSNRLGMQVIAEGIETMALARCMTGLGCHGMQGFAIAHPMPAERLAAWVRADPHERSALPTA